MVNMGWGCLHAAGMGASDPDAHCIPRRHAWRGWEQLWPYAQTRGRDMFLRATGPVRPLLGELEEFVLLH